MNGGQSYFRYDGNIQLVLDDAELSIGVDTIILPGGQFILNNDLFITSPVVMIGSGIRADSSTAYPTRTVLSGNNYRDVRIMDEADGTELHGITFRGSIGVYIGQNLATSDADNVRITRCDIALLWLGHGNFDSNANSPYISNCIIDDLSVNQCNDPLIRSCFIQNLTGADAASNTVVENCVFLNWSGGGNVNVSYKNNVFLRNTASPFTVNEASTFDYNLFVGSGAGVSYTIAAPAVNGGNNVASAEYPMNTVNGAFPQFGPVANYITYDYQGNYSINSLYQSAGEAGTEVGVFGGADPWKTGSLPFNPHWSELTGPASTGNGTLQGVTVRGSAQTY
ncbi:MAG: hypothetical protein IPJ87_00075 [Flavobacteriales bacterium]|nr:hypothetical protein [Flavobacteriales bacterium]